MPVNFARGGSRRLVFCILRFRTYHALYTVETSGGLYHLPRTYRKCPLNRREDKKVLHRRSYIELGHILCAARSCTSTGAKAHNVCARRVE